MKALIILVGASTIAIACTRPPARSTACQDQISDCLARCQRTDSDVERSTRESSPSDTDRRTSCEQSCDDACN